MSSEPDEAIADALVAKDLVGKDQPYTALLMARTAIRVYERTVPSDRLQAILSERRHAVNEIIPTSTLEERAEPGKCHCGRRILPGQVYAVDGPEHIGCRR